jgi:hypothetical protein
MTYFPRQRIAGFMISTEKTGARLRQARALRLPDGKVLYGVYRDGERLLALIAACSAGTDNAVGLFAIEES